MIKNRPITDTNFEFIIQLSKIKGPRCFLEQETLL